MTLVERARAFATEKHQGQQRKYTLEPYIVHPEAVAGIITGIGGTEEQIAAAWLHDVVEDCGVSTFEICEKFGHEVALYVEQLTDVSLPQDGNRAARKAIDLEHTRKCCAAAATVKLADLIDNSYTILRYDPSFGAVYLAEKRRLLEVLRHGDAALWQIASEIVAKAEVQEAKC